MFYVTYMMRSGDFFSSLDSGLKLFKRAKLPILPSQIYDIEEFREMFDKTYQTWQRKTED
jgi:hypothetical protein